jgi:hypothetical protein
MAASFGVLRARIDISQAHANPTVPNSVASAEWRDNLVTNAPGREGQNGFVTVKFTVHGVLNRSGVTPQPRPWFSDSTHNVRAFLTFLKDESSGIQINEGYYDDGTPFPSKSFVPFLGIEQTVTYPVVFGTPYDLRFAISASATFWNYPGFTGGRLVTDLGSTAVWGGIASVTDANGNPIPNATHTAASGANYTQPITPTCADSPAGLTSWWPGDTNTRDIRGANNGFLENGATYNTGRVGSAFSFPTAGARVRIPNAASLNFNATQDYTVDFWKRTARPSLTRSRLQPNGTLVASASDGTNTASVTSTSGTGALAVGVVHDNVWHHIAAVFKHSTQTLELYIDGSLNASQAYTGTLGTLANGQPLYFGARSDGSNSFNGSLDEVDIHNAALTLAQIQSIAAAAGLGKCRPAVVPTSVVSRKTHGGTPFDINLPLSGTTGVESRSGGATSDYQIVATFPAPVTVTGTPQAEVVGGNGTIGTNGTANGGAVSISGNTVTIPLTSVVNAQTLSIRLNAADNGASTADVLVPLSVLIGDTNGDRVVNGGDAIQTRARAGQGASETNFRSDVNTDGVVNGGDTISVRNRSGTALP